MSTTDTSFTPLLATLDSLNSMKRTARGTVILDPSHMSIATLRTLHAKSVRSARVHVAKVVADHGASFESVERVLRETAQGIHDAGLSWPIDAQFNLATWARLATTLEGLHGEYGTRFVADHMFCADGAAAGSGDLDTVLRLVERGIVFVKISGMAKFADELDDLKPVVEAVLRCRGGSMVMWGSDWPHANMHGDVEKVDVERQLRFLHAICEAEGQGYWEKLTRDNAAGLYA